MTSTTSNRIARIMEAAGYPDQPVSASGQALRRVIEQELCAQDRDTRHACAEAINLSLGDYYADSDKLPTTVARRAIERAHQAVMNTSTI